MLRGVSNLAVRRFDQPMLKEALLFLDKISDDYDSSEDIKRLKTERDRDIIEFNKTKCYMKIPIKKLQYYDIPSEISYYTYEEHPGTAFTLPTMSTFIFFSRKFRLVNSKKFAISAEGDTIVNPNGQLKISGIKHNVIIKQETYNISPSNYYKWLPLTLLIPTILQFSPDLGSNLFFGSPFLFLSFVPYGNLFMINRIEIELIKVP